MNTTDLEQLRYPIGRFKIPEEFSEKDIQDWIGVLEHFPKRLEHLVNNLTDQQLDTPYRTDGWTVRQVVHHVSDSHHHSYTRFKWALTEDEPVIKAYHEDRWAELEDSKTAPLAMSLQHIKAIHVKLVYLLKNMSLSDFDKGFIHPDYKSLVTLKLNLALYAWHSNHHYAHIENLLQREGWISS